MRLKVVMLFIGAIFLFTSTVAATDSEEEFIQKYLNKIEKKHTQRLTWISGHFALDRINRDNDYNRFANVESANLTDGTIPWLGEAKSFGLDFGMVFAERFAWTLSGAYWLKMGTSLEGSYFYEPTGTYIDDPASELQVFGISTGVEYYVWNPPKIDGTLDKLALRVGAGVGYYKATWDVWSEYQNLNLATSTTDPTAASFEDNAIGFSANVGVDYPTRFLNLVLGVDVGALYLNFDNVAWFTSQDQEVIATYTGDSDGRVDLELTGITGKIQLKRFFSW
jgi:hypothetical protein